MPRMGLGLGRPPRRAFQFALPPAPEVVLPPVAWLVGLSAGRPAILAAPLPPARPVVGRVGDRPHVTG